MRLLTWLQPAEQGEVYSTPSEPQMGLKPRWEQRHCAVHSVSWGSNPELSMRREFIQLWSITGGHLTEQMNCLWAGISEHPLGCTANSSSCDPQEFQHHPKPLLCLSKASQPQMGTGATPFLHVQSQTWPLGPKPGLWDSCNTKPGLWIPNLAFGSQTWPLGLLQHQAVGGKEGEE